MIFEWFRLNRKKGTLIVFEGISGCGKSDSIMQIKDSLSSQGYQVYVSEWNSNKTIRNIVHKLSASGLMNAYVYSFFQWLGFLKDYLTIILPRLREGNILVADRYIYTGITRDRVNASLDLLGKIICKWVRKPELIFFFDTDPKVCLNRIQRRKKELFHTNKKIHNSKRLKNKDLYYLKKLRNAYVQSFNNAQIIGDSKLIKISNNSKLFGAYIEVFLKMSPKNLSGIENIKPAVNDEC